MSQEETCCFIEILSGVRLYVHLIPGGAKEQVEGVVRDEKGKAYLKVRVKAPPIEGKANQALCRYLAKQLKVSASAIKLLSGEMARKKTLCISTTSEEEKHLICNWIREKQMVSTT